jgi:hypothetical protein
MNVLLHSALIKMGRAMFSLLVGGVALFMLACARGLPYEICPTISADDLLPGIYVLSPKNCLLKRITFNEKGDGIVWSSDARRIAFVRHSTDFLPGVRNINDLFVINATGSSVLSYKLVVKGALSRYSEATSVWRLPRGHRASDSTTDHDC